MRALTIALVAALLFSATAGAEDYQWTISNSPTDPYSNTDVPTLTVRTLYLWLACAAQGAQCAEFDIASTGSLLLLAVTPSGPWIQIAPPPDLLLCFLPCTSTPSVAAALTVLDFPGSLCIVPSATNGINVTVDCEANPQLHPNAVIGYANDGTDPCVVGTCPDPVTVDGSSWGSVKSLYR